MSIFNSLGHVPTGGLQGAKVRELLEGAAKLLPIGSGEKALVPFDNQLTEDIMRLRRPQDLHLQQA